MTEVKRVVRVVNRRGLHARASAKFVTLASQLPVAVHVGKDGAEVAGTSIMGLMMLGAAMGDEISVRADGEGAADAVERLCALVEGKFGED